MVCIKVADVAASTPTVVKQRCHHRFVLSTLPFALVLLLGCGMVVGLDVGGAYDDGGGNGVEADATGRTRFGQGAWKRFFSGRGRDGDGDPSTGGDDSSSSSSSVGSTTGPDYQIYRGVSGNNGVDFINVGSSSSSSSWSEMIPNANKDTTSNIGNLPRPRIVEGQDAGEDEYNAYVELLGEYICGGSLIAPNIVLTAAHCYSTTLEYVSVNTWEMNANIGEEVGDAQHVQLSRILQHPNYGGGVFSCENDFMLLELSTPFSNLPFITLNADDSLPKLGEDYVVIGLGLTDSTVDDSLPDVLQELTVQQLDSDVCYDFFENNAETMGLFKEEVMFCVGESDLLEGATTCHGDSGGPIMYVNNNGGTKEQVQIGVVSWGDPSCDSPTAYGRVSSAYDWIKGVVCDDWGNTDAPFCDGTSTGTDPSSTPSPSVAPDPACEDATDTLFKFQITTDINGYGSDVSWKLFDESKNVILYDDGFVDGETRQYAYCLSQTVGCYYLDIIDLDDDHQGFCCDGTLDSEGQCCDGVKAGFGIQFGTEEYVDFENPNVDDYPTSVAFTEFIMCPLGYTPDGTAAPTGSPSTDSDGEGSGPTAPATAAPCSNSGKITIDLITDTYPDETTVLMFGDDYEILTFQAGFGEENTEYTQTTCYEGCLRFGLLDTLGDGLTPPAGVNITYGGETVVEDQEVSDIGFGAVAVFGMDCPDILPILDGEDCQPFDLHVSTSTKWPHLVDLTLVLMVGDQYDVLLHERPRFRKGTDDDYKYSACLIGCVTVGVFGTTSPSAVVVDVKYGAEKVGRDGIGPDVGVIFPIGC